MRSEARYRPYGSPLSLSGRRLAFGWVGAPGHNEAAGVPHAELSIWARIYSSTGGRWITVDPLWPMEMAYAYVVTNPATFIDPTGLQFFPIIPGLETPPILLRPPTVLRPPILRPMPPVDIPFDPPVVRPPVVRPPAFRPPGIGPSFPEYIPPRRPVKGDDGCVDPNPGRRFPTKSEIAKDVRRELHHRPFPRWPTKELPYPVSDDPCVRDRDDCEYECYRTVRSIRPPSEKSRWQACCEQWCGRILLACNDASKTGDYPPEKPEWSCERKQPW